MTETKLKRPNPLPPDMMSPGERRTELCGLLALGLVRLLLRERGKDPEITGEIRLHSPAITCRHATPTQGENA